MKYQQINVWTVGMLFALALSDVSWGQTRSETPVVAGLRQSEVQTNIETIPRSESVFAEVDGPNSADGAEGLPSAIGDIPTEAVDGGPTAQTQIIEPPEPTYRASEPRLWTDNCNGDGGCGGYCSDCQCSSDCGAACPSGCPAGCERMWVRGELLLWWLNGATAPPLVTTSPAGTLRASAGVLPTADILAGGEAIGNQVRLGGRITAGGWVGEEHAIEGYYMYLGADDSGDFRGESIAGAPILARPFFNARDLVQDSQLIGFPGVVEGTVAVESDSDLQSAGVHVRQVLSEGPTSRFDLVGGYRYLRFEESISITEDLTILDPAGLFQQFSRVGLRDAFATANQWHGGDFGLAATVDGGRVSLDLLAKLGVGAMSRHSQIRGATIVTTPSGAVAGSPVGLLAASTNSGGAVQNGWSLIPELNVRLRYRAHKNISLGVGYNLLYVTQVLRAANMIDTNLNPNQVPIRGGAAPFVGPALPARLRSPSTLRAQGLNFIAEMRF